MPFSNSILAGDTLVRNAAQSEGFQTGMQGWRFERSGDAEFNNIIVRGTIQTAVPPARRIEIKTSPANRISFIPEEVTFNEGFLEVTDSNSVSALLMKPPWGGTAPPSLLLQVDNTDPDGASARIVANSIQFANPIPYDDNEVHFEQGNLVTSTPWRALVMANSWVNFGGTSQPMQICRYPDGDIGLRGIIKNGTVGGIANLPTWAWPPADIGWMVPISGSSARLTIAASSGVLTVVYSAAAAVATHITVRYSILS
jgi:hypothetical protein